MTVVLEDSNMCRSMTFGGALLAPPRSSTTRESSLTRALRPSVSILSGRETATLAAASSASGSFCRPRASGSSPCWYATMAAVRPQRSLGAVSAPAASNVSIAWWCPAAAARCSGVSSHSLVTLASLVASTSWTRVRSEPAAAAWCNGVMW